MRTLLYYLAVLNLFDAIITFFGLHYSYIQESNPLMYKLYEINPFLFIGLKCTLSLLLIWFTSKKRLFQSRLPKMLTIFAAVLYTFTFLLHSYWLYII